MNELAGINTIRSSIRASPDRAVLLVGWLVLTGCAPTLSAAPIPAVQPGAARDWADPNSKAPKAVVFRVWQEYIRSKEGRLALNAGAPSSYWVAEEQANWPMYDLAGFYVPEGTTPEVITIRPAASADAPEYEIVTRFTVEDSVTHAQRTVLTVAVSAVLRGDRWLLANVLPRRTKSWHSETVGQITYFVEPGLDFKKSRANRAVAFVDSLAAAFDVTRLGPLDYYVTSTVDAALQALGVEYPTTFGQGAASPSQ